MPSTFIADTPYWLEHRVQIPGTPCADPKSMSMTDRVDQGVGIQVLRHHDTLGVLPIPDVSFAHNMLIAHIKNNPLSELR